MMGIHTVAARHIFLESGEKVANVFIPTVTLIKPKLL